jgi:DNA-binding transcriptional LysR family regulator
VSIRLHEFRHRTLLEDAVEQGVADFAIGPRPVRRWDGPLEVVGFEELVVVAAEDDVLAARDRIGLEELADREWVLYHPDHGLAGIHDEICVTAGFIPRGAVRTSQAEGAARMAAAGLGLALVPDNIVLPAVGCTVLALEPRIFREVAVYARVGWSSTAEAFVEMLRATAQTRPDGTRLIRL